MIGGLPLITYAPRGVGGSSLLYISIVYYMLKGGEGVQIACKIAYVLNGRLLGKEKVISTSYANTFIFPL